MAGLHSLGTMVETDVLIIGHGIAGLAAAITVKENDPTLDVLAVDKASVGYGGKANKGGGHCAFIPEGGEEQYVEYHTRNLGDYLNDQDLLRLYAHSTRDVLRHMESWGVKIVGKDTPFRGHPIIPWMVVVVDLDLLLHMARHAKRLGVRFMEKVSVVDLLTDGDRVVGAIGFSLLDGTTYIYKAKAVILANGGQNWGIMRMWSSGRGDGIAAAYRAGAKMRNAEFGSFVNMVHVETKMVAYGAEDCLYNSKGERLGSRAQLAEGLKTVVGGVDIGGHDALYMYWEVRQGNGPIYENTEENKFPYSPPGKNLCLLSGTPDPEWRRPVAEKFWERLLAKKRAGYRTPGPLRETIPGLIGECTPLYVDHNMATSLKGLFGAGDICGNGSAWTGAVPTPPGRNRGSGLVNAVFTARLAGQSAAKYALAQTSDGIIDAGQVETLKNEIFAPLRRYSGVTTDEIIWGVKNVMQPLKYSIWKSEERLKEALDKVMALKELLNLVVARDYHYLSTANECRSMVLCAEMFFRASLARKESRGWHLREDYPARDDKNFLRWIVLQKKNGEMEVSFEDLPMHKYRYKPEGYGD